MICRMRSLASRYGGISPSSTKRMVGGTLMSSLPVPTMNPASVLPMPVANWPKAPALQVWESVPNNTSPAPQACESTTTAKPAEHCRPSQDNLQHPSQSTSGLNFGHASPRVPSLLTPHDNAIAHRSAEELSKIEKTSACKKRNEAWVTGPAWHNGSVSSCGHRPWQAHVGCCWLHRAGAGRNKRKRLSRYSLKLTCGLAAAASRSGGMGYPRVPSAEASSRAPLELFWAGPEPDQQLTANEGSPLSPLPGRRRSKGHVNSSANVCSQATRVGVPGFVWPSCASATWQTPL